METGRIAPYSLRELGVLYVAWLALCVMVFNNAWVAEDAYISFRVIDNFSQGYGLRWNIYERVQAYTHPLWLLLHIPLYKIWHNLFQVTIGLSIFCTMAAVLVVLASVKKPLHIALACFFLPLMTSSAFIDYATSGLENPLSYLLFAVFGYIILNLQTHRQFWLFSSLTVALAMVNRLDSLILFLPAMLWLGYSRRDANWRQILLGALPLFAWLSFSLFYYGFLFPNTKYAKLNTGLGLFHYLKGGLHYAFFLFVMDTASALTLLVAPVFIAVAWRRRTRLPRAWHLPLSVAAGICANLLYVIYIGGDYMAGRFWAVPVFASAWLATIIIPEKIRPDMLFCLVCALLTGYFTPIALRETNKDCETCLIDKGRIINAHNTFKLNRLVTSLWPLRLRDEGKYMFADDGRKLAKESPIQARSMFFIGMSAFYAGPNYSIVDELGLADPLLARMPTFRQRDFYIGHFKRPIPDGYLDAVTTGSTEKMDPDLARYYEKLRLITSGPLLDSERLKTIATFNMGFYDHWKKDYLKRHAP